MIDLFVERALGLRTAALERAGGCAGPGRCHGCVVWCADCGDVSRACDAPERCDRHRPLTDEHVDRSIRHWLLTEGVEDPCGLVRAVAEDRDEVLPPPPDRVRERLIALMADGKIVVRERGWMRWTGGAS